MVDVPIEEGEESPLERVRRRLYEGAASRVTPNTPSETQGPVASVKGWKPDAPGKRGLSATAWFFIISLGFFLIAGIAAALILFFGARSVSNDRMDISFDGPVTVDGGKPVSFGVIVENGNPVDASHLLLTIDFPPEAYDPLTNEPLGHYTAPVQDLIPGESNRTGLSVVFYGSENQHLSIPVSLEYMTPNSSAVFVKEVTQDVSIVTSPLSVRVSAIPEISSGQKFTMTITVRSNAPESLKDVALKVEYPFGFAVVTSEPVAIGQGVYSLGTLAPGEEASVHITGTLAGQDGEERVFRFAGGVLQNTDATTLRTPAYTLADTSVKITRAFLATTLSLNQENGDLIAQEGDEVQAVLSWINTLTSTVADGELRVALSGDAIAPSSVAVVNGFYRSSDKTVVFDKSTEAGLRTLAPGESGAGSFRFLIKDGSALRSLRSPSATLTVSVAGRRSTEDGRTENLSSTLTRTVKIASSLELAASAVHTTGPFENSGPLPPKSDTETMYSILWSVENTINTVASVRVSATLPTYVRFTGTASPAGAFTFDEATRKLTWTIGEMAPGTLRAGAFQVAFLPSVSQVGSTPVLLQDQKTEGFDRFTQSNIEDEVSPLNTELTNEAGFHPGDGRVK